MRLLWFVKLAMLRATDRLPRHILESYALLPPVLPALLGSIHHRSLDIHPLPASSIDHSAYQLEDVLGVFHFHLVGHRSFLVEIFLLYLDIFGHAGVYFQDSYQSLGFR